MNTVVELLSVAQREDAIRAVQAIIPECVQASALEVGDSAFKAFFGGYKDSIEACLKAA